MKERVSLFELPLSFIVMQVVRHSPPCRRVSNRVLENKETRSDGFQSEPSVQLPT